MLEQFTTTITPLGRERTIRIYLPPGYDPAGAQRFPVLYMHDGQNLFRDEEASFGTSWGIADYLEQHGPALIVVGIDCSQVGIQRLDEYAPWPNRAAIERLFGKEIVGSGGEGRLYIDWVARELKPLIDQRYRTLPDQSAMGGSSMGALISTYAACLYPSLFRRIAAVSPAYWFNLPEIEALIQESDLSPLERFYMDVGTRESTGEIDARHYVETAQRVAGSIGAKVERTTCVVAEGAEHNEAAWRARLPQIFGYLYGEG